MARSDPVARIRERALRELERTNGRLVAEDVVAAARDTAHVLHDYFEWDDSVAGEQWRLQQARTLIREVRISLVSDDIVMVAPVYISDPDPGRADNAYVHLAPIAKKKELAKRVLLDEFARIEGALVRARAVAAVLNLSSDLEAMVRALLDMRRKVDEAA